MTTRLASGIVFFHGHRATRRDVRDGSWYRQFRLRHQVVLIAPTRFHALDYVSKILGALELAQFIGEATKSL